MLQRAAAALRERPVLFKYCAAEVAGARHNALFQRRASPLCIMFPIALSYAAHLQSSSAIFAVQHRRNGTVVVASDPQEQLDC